MANDTEWCMNDYQALVKKLAKFVIGWQKENEQKFPFHEISDDVLKEVEVLEALNVCNRMRWIVVIHRDAPLQAITRVGFQSFDEAMKYCREQYFLSGSRPPHKIEITMEKY